MPIYAYRCASCGHSRDVLQKLSDPVLTVCPACGEAAFRKQPTAAGFQLKGSGWYATDFRGGGKAEAAKKDATGDGAAAGDEGGSGTAGAPKAAEAAAPASGPDRAAPATGGTPPAA